jgi:exopolysaccharide production protein ExoY
MSSLASWKKPEVRMTQSCDSVTISAPPHFGADRPTARQFGQPIFLQRFERETGDGREMFRAVAGRVIDLTIATFVLAMMLPALLIIALFIWSADGASPIFAHRRVGRGKRLFPCYKFRTMVPDAEKRLRAFLEQNASAAEEWRRDRKLRDDPRVTALGRFLRKSSLDEIPQLVNVLLGHMTLVGPRPIVEEEQARYGKYLVHYCSVKPGITGLWQISGRNDVSYRRRVALDTYYSRSKKSLRFDLLILTKTIPAVVLAKGSS